MDHSFDSKMIESKEVLEETGISRVALNNYIRAGFIPRPSIWNDVAYFPSDVLEDIKIAMEREGSALPGDDKKPKIQLQKAVDLSHQPKDHRLDSQNALPKKNGNEQDRQQLEAEIVSSPHAHIEKKGEPVMPNKYEKYTEIGALIKRRMQRKREKLEKLSKKERWAKCIEIEGALDAYEDINFELLQRDLLMNSNQASLRNESGDICPDCGFSNPAGFLFCGKCGHALSQG